MKKIEVGLSVLKYLKLYVRMVVVYCCLERENYKDLQFHADNLSFIQ